MKFVTFNNKQFIFFSLIISLGCFSQSLAQISSAYVSQGSTNRLIVNLSSSTTLNNSDGWYLVGGGAEVKRLLSGSGGSSLTFELTDHVLPDDQFTLYYYQELGNAFSNGVKTRSAEQVSVKASGISSYQGSGKIYYVSKSGSSGSSGTSPSQPTSFSKAIGKASSGDYVLLKKGETWSSPLAIENKRGTQSSPVTIGTYGSGSKPIISGDATTIEIRDSHYLQVVGLETRPSSGSRTSGARILGDSRYCKLRSLTVTGPQKYSDGTGEGTGISYSSASGSGKFPYHSIVMHCEVSRFRDGIYGYSINGGGELCFNKVSYCAVDGIRAFDGDTDGIIIGHNEITKYSDDGIDLFNGSEVIVQYNKIHDPIQPRSGGANNGIKGGGASGSTASRDNIIRYNTVYNLSARGKSPNGITTNGCVSGEIYGNLCYNIDDNAIEITASKTNKSWKVYNNTAISNRVNGFHVAPNNPDVTAYNNIFQGPKTDIRVDGSSRVTGKNNILVNNKKFGNYSGQNDFGATVASLFVNHSNKDFQLKKESPAINKGTYVSNYKGDILGKKMSGNHDVGCYEYDGESTPAKNPTPTPTPEPEPEPKPEPAPSPQPEPTSPPTSSTSGLRYQYYQGEWSELPNFSSQSVVKQGKVSNFSLSPRTRNDNFGMVFEGQIKIDKSGTYTFYVSADDGVKLFINGKQVVADDGLHPARERSGSVSLSTGLHPIRVEYFERRGKQVLDVSYQSSGLSKRSVPSDKLFMPSGTSNPEPTPTPEPQPTSPPTSSTPGLRYQYYQGNWNKLPNFSSQSVIKQGNVSNFSLSPRSRDEYFGMVFEGQIKIDKPGTYTFYTTADDGVKLFINGKQVVADDGIHAARERSGSISLSSGMHSIKVEYFDRTYDEVLEVRYEGAGVSKQRIPDSKLFLPSSSNQRANAGVKDKKMSGVVLGESFEKITAYPNPIRQSLTVELPTDVKEVDIKFINMIGATVWHKKLPETSTQVVIGMEDSKMPPGYYLLVISNQNKIVYTNKVLKE